MLISVHVRYWDTCIIDMGKRYNRCDSFKRVSCHYFGETLSVAFHSEKLKASPGSWSTKRSNAFIQRQSLRFKGAATSSIVGGVKESLECKLTVICGKRDVIVQQIVFSPTTIIRENLLWTKTLGQWCEIGYTVSLAEVFAERCVEACGRIAFWRALVFIIFSPIFPYKILSSSAIITDNGIGE